MTKKIDLVEFINSSRTNWHIIDSGLRYYVRKSVMFEGLIELASCSALPTRSKKPQFNYWRFLKKYEATIPFLAEQVINPKLADLYRRRKWTEYQIGGVPQFFSPLAVSRYSGQRYFKRLARSKEDDVHIGGSIVSFDDFSVEDMMASFDQDN